MRRSLCNDLMRMLFSAKQEELSWALPSLACSCTRPCHNLTQAFHANAESGMLEMMTALLGTPNDRIWPALAALPSAAVLQLPYQPYNYLKKARAEKQCFRPGLI